MKRCSKCGELKPLDSFYKQATGRDGRRADCKDCFAVRARDWYSKNRDHAVERARKWQQDNPERVRAYRRQRNALNREQVREGHLRRKFGLTLDSYAELLARQGDGCAICGEPEETSSHHVDHDHYTGEVCGILCVRCNNGLGQFQEDPAILATALSYLLGHERDAVRKAGSATRERAFALRRAG
jgi:hypothetical protein